jgi:hypothetical protein
LILVPELHPVVRRAGSNNVQKLLHQWRWLKFEPRHTFTTSLESAIFTAIHPFFFPFELSKMHPRTFSKQKINK